MGTLELGIGVNRKMCIFDYQKNESHHMFVIKHYAIELQYNNCSFQNHMQNHNFNISYIPFKES